MFNRLRGQYIQFKYILKLCILIIYLMLWLLLFAVAMPIATANKNFNKKDFISNKAIY